jgi:acyl carrier protein
MSNLTCRQLAAYKHPVGIEIVAELSRKAAGRVDQRRLRVHAAEGGTENPGVGLESTEQILDRLESILREVWDDLPADGQVDREAPLLGLGVDSITLVTLLDKVEAEFSATWDQNSPPGTHSSLRSIAELLTVGARGMADLSGDAESVLAWFRRMRAENPVSYDEGARAWHVFGYADVARVLSDPATFSSDFSGLTSAQKDVDLFSRGTIIRKDPPVHRKLRTLVLRSSKQVDELPA